MMTAYTSAHLITEQKIRFRLKKGYGEITKIGKAYIFWYIIIIKNVICVTLFCLNLLTNNSVIFTRCMSKQMYVAKCCNTLYWTRIRLSS